MENIFRIYANTEAEFAYILKIFSILLNLDFCGVVCNYIKKRL